MTVAQTVTRWVLAVVVACIAAVLGFLAPVGISVLILRGIGQSATKPEAITVATAVAGATVAWTCAGGWAAAVSKPRLALKLFAIPVVLATPLSFLARDSFLRDGLLVACTGIALIVWRAPYRYDSPQSWQMQVVEVGRVLIWVIEIALYLAALGLLYWTIFGSGEPLMAVLLAGGILLVALGLMVAAESASFRLLRKRWTVLPAQIVHRQGRWTSRLKLLGYPAFLMMLLPTLFKFGSGQDLWTSKGIIAGGVMLFVTLAVLYGAAKELENVFRAGVFRPEIAMDARGLRLHAVINDTGQTIPWREIESVSQMTLQLRYNSLTYMILKINAPERFGLRLMGGVDRWFLHVDGNVEVPLSGYLESPNNIFKDVKAFHDRYGRPTPASSRIAENAS